MEWAMIWMLTISNITALTTVETIEWATRAECEAALVGVVSADPKIFINAVCVRTK